MLLSATSGDPLDGPQLLIDASSYDDSSILIRVDPDADPLTTGLYELHAQYSTGGAIQSFSVLGGLQVVHLADGVSVIDALADYSANDSVLYAEFNYRVELLLAPGDPQFDQQWALNNTGQTGGSADADIDALEAWGITTGSGGTIVAVIDTGVDYTHQDLAANMWINAGEIAGDGIDNDGNGYVDDIHGYDFFNDDGDPLDDHNHGTHVAGTIGAVGDNGLGVTGVNWDVQIMALKFLDSTGNGSIADAIEALNYAVANGARLSNNSWGFNGQFSQALFDAIENARDEGHVFVAAAGNGNIFGIGQNNDTTPFWPSSYDLDNIVAVAATDHNDNLAFFSNYGAASVDLAAPGVNILSTTIGNTYSVFSGTSMATPHVTGALALLLDQHPDWTSNELIDRLLETVDPIDSVQGVTVTGGRLNVASALLADVTGPRVIAHTPASTFDDVGSLRVRFSKPVQAATFTLDDIVSFSGPPGGIAVTAIHEVDGSGGREFDIVFATQSEFGTYTLVFGPEIADLEGEFMDQDADLTSGEPIDDRYTAVFEIEPFNAHFDFGTETSPVALGYTQVTPATTYNVERGFGWQSGSVSAASRVNGTALSVDLNFSNDATFVVDVSEASVYDVTLTMGDTGGFAHQQMAVFLEGVQVAVISTAAGQVVTSTYQTSVVDGQLTVRIVDLGGSDPNFVINGLDVQLAGPDVAGPAVTSAEWSGAVPKTLDRVVLTFDEAIDATSFTVDDVSIGGPGGSITPTAVNGLSAVQFEVLFASQEVPGDYSITVGPDVHDVAGNAMDQDGDGTNGEAGDDQFTSQFSIAPFEGLLLDFGTSSSPVEAGYTRATSNSTYNSLAGYGWLSGSVLSTNRTSGTALTRDLNFSKDAIFVVDVPDGVYEVTITMGDTAGFVHDQMGVFLEGVLFDTVTTAGGQVVTNTYQVSVSDGQLTIHLDDLGGSDANVVINGLEVQPAGPDVEGPRIIASDPAGSVSGTIDRIVLSFDEAIDAGSFTLADMVSFNGPDGAITATAVNQLTPAEFEILFAAQQTPGDYTLVVGPDIFDAAGNALDQDDDGAGGEVPDDQFTLTFTLEPFQALFDFGTTSSPVEPGYTQIDQGDLYSAGMGYGWLSGSVLSTNRAGGTALTRDLNFTADATFAVDLADGVYDVTVVMGDTAGFAHDQMAVIIEGVQLDLVNTAPGQVVTNAYRVSVADGQFTLRLQDQGGSDANAVINGLELRFVGFDMAGPQVVSADPTGNVMGSVDRITLSFNEALRDGTFTLADVVSLTGPNGAITPLAVNKLGDAQYEVVFDRQFAAGDYSLTIGPDIEDVAGNLMDQDGDGTGGETPDDEFTTGLTLESFLVGFDFGTAASPVEPGFIGITPGDTYNSTSGYGWQSGNVLATDRTTGTPLTRDLNFSALATFVVDVPTGTYQVTLTMGDTGAFGHDQMGVFLEGTLADTVTTAPREIVTNTYVVEVTDGQLTLLLDDLGGSDANVVVNGLQLALLTTATSGGSATILASAAPAPSSQPAPPELPVIGPAITDAAPPDSPAGSTSQREHGRPFEAAFFSVWNGRGRSAHAHAHGRHRNHERREWNRGNDADELRPWNSRENSRRDRNAAECAALDDAFCSGKLFDALLSLRR